MAPQDSCTDVTRLDAICPAPDRGGRLTVAQVEIGASRRSAGHRDAHSPAATTFQSVCSGDVVLSLGAPTIRGSPLLLGMSQADGRTRLELDGLEWAR